MRPKIESFHNCAETLKKDDFKAILQSDDYTIQPLSQGRVLSIATNPLDE